MSFTAQYLSETAKIVQTIDDGAIEATAEGLASVRSAGGRLFILGVGGSAGHASHGATRRRTCPTPRR